MLTFSQNYKRCLLLKILYPAVSNTIRGTRAGTQQIFTNKIVNTKLPQNYSFLTHLSPLWNIQNAYARFQLSINSYHMQKLKTNEIHNGRSLSPFGCHILRTRRSCQTGFCLELDSGLVQWWLSVLISFHSTECVVGTLVNLDAYWRERDIIRATSDARVCTLGLLKIVTEEEHELENPGKEMME